MVRPWVLALPAAATLGIVYVVCAAVVALLPEVAGQVSGLVFHGVVFKATTLPAASFVAGLALTVIGTFVITAAFAVLYNSCVSHCRKRGRI